MKKTLSLFQCDYHRSLEENFAQVLTENESVRLFFINENRAFTDGKNIVVDPGLEAAFANQYALYHTEIFMHLAHRISTDPWYALRMMTRGQNIHECLHILYTNFPVDMTSDSRATTKARQKTLAFISNIIEDAFIEAVGCCVFDNLELYLRFIRMATLFSQMPTQGTLNRAFETDRTDKTGAKSIPEPASEPTSDYTPEPLELYLDYMLSFLLYPMIRQEAPTENIADFVEQTKPLFMEGSVCGDADERFAYSQRVFDIIEPIIPVSEAEIDRSRLMKMLYGAKTHSGESTAITNITSKGRTAHVTRRLFTDITGHPLPTEDFNKQLYALVQDYEYEKKTALDIVLFQPIVVTWKGAQFDCHTIHKGIEIVETKPKPNLNLRKAYQNIYNKYHLNINAYHNRFTQRLKTRMPTRDERRLFGTGISTRYLADSKKRYWYRKENDFGIPDMAVMLLIDGSGSMYGDLRQRAMVSCVILHEVLKKQGISHAIVEHRAIYDKPKVLHNILIDFNGREEEKYNILALDAIEGTREGLSLFWAERYMVTNTVESKRLIIVLSDGAPAHSVAGEAHYIPPISVKDTYNAAKKIIKRGTSIIAVALDAKDEDTTGDTAAEDHHSCYTALSEIYPSVIACTDLKRLTGQLLGIISKHLS